MKKWMFWMLMLCCSSAVFSQDIVGVHHSLALKVRHGNGPAETEHLKGKVAGYHPDDEYGDDVSGYFY